MDTYTVTERLALTADDRLVPEEDADARWLYAIPGQEIPVDEALRYGLIDAKQAKEIEAQPEPPKEEPKGLKIEGETKRSSRRERKKQ